MDVVTGTTSADTFNAYVNYNSAATANTTSTLTATDIINGNTGIDALTLTIDGTLDGGATVGGDPVSLPGADISNIETINIRNVATSLAAADILTINASTLPGATAINADRATGALTLTSVANTTSVGLIGNGILTNGALTATYATTATSPVLNISGGTTAGAVSVTAAGATGFTVNSTGAANTIGTLAAPGSATSTLTVNADTNLTTGAITTSVKQINVSGLATKVTLGAITDATLTTINAAGLSAGGVAVTLLAGVTSLTGGEGNDTVTTATLTTTTAGEINGGNGTDTLIVAAAANVATAALRGAYTGFEVLNNATTANIAASGFTGVTSLITSAAGSGFTGLTASQAANITATADLAATAITYSLTTDTGTSDVLGLELKSSTATSELDATALTVSGFETVNLKVSSGGTSLYSAAGTALTAATDYSDIDFAAATGLKTITLAGAYAAKIDASTFTSITSIDASANTAGANIVTGGQTGALTVTGTALADIIALGAVAGSGTQTINTGTGNDKITAAQADIAVAVINGGAGTDTLVISDGTPTIADSTFTNISSIEKISLGSATTLNWVVGGYANALATANGGVLDITAAVLTGATTIDGSGLGAANSLKLTLTNVDTAANATATAVTLSQGADNITITQAGAPNTDTITISGGTAALAATTAKTIDLSAVTVSGAISVTTGAGADTIKASGLVGTYTAGAGADTITLVATDGAAQTLTYSAANSSTTTAFDVVNNFQMITTNGDLLDFATTALLTSAQMSTTGWTVSTGIATKSGAAVADFITAFAGSTTAGAVAFSDGTNTWVGYSDGTAATTTSDILVELVGLNTATSISVTPGAAAIGIV